MAFYARTVDGVEVAFSDVGVSDGNAATLVLIHGLGSYMPVWQRNLDALAQHHRVVAIDLPGYGKSPKAREGLTMADIAQACWEAIDDAYPGERAILVGCSIGSSMLIWMHNHRPLKTAALIMCGTGYNPKKEFIPARIEIGRAHV